MSSVIGTVINITDIRKFKIVRIKDTDRNILHMGKIVTELIFTYENSRYKFIKYKDTIEKMQYYILEMYEYNRETNEYNLIAKGDTCRLDTKLYEDISDRKTKYPTYTNIDKQQLVLKLTYWGFVQGKYTESVDAYNKQRREIQSAIKKLKKEILKLEEKERKLQENFFRSTGRGSKITDVQFKAQISERNIGKG